MAYKQLTHDIRVSYSDSSSAEQTLVNNLTQQYIITNPESYNSSKIVLLSTTPITISGINFIYLSCENLIKVFLNNSTQEQLVQHLSVVNLSDVFDIKLVNVIGQSSSEVQLFYGSVGD